MADLRVEPERQRFNRHPVATRRLALSLLELLEQVRRNGPLPGRRGGHQAHALELAQAASRKSSERPLSPSLATLVDAAVGGSDLGEVSIDRLDGRLALGLERDEVPDAQGVGHAGGDRHVVGVPRRRLDHGVERPPVELVAQAFADDASRRGSARRRRPGRREAPGRAAPRGSAPRRRRVAHGASA